MTTFKKYVLTILICTSNVSLFAPDPEEDVGFFTSLAVCFCLPQAERPHSPAKLSRPEAAIFGTLAATGLPLLATPVSAPLGVLGCAFGITGTLFTGIVISIITDSSDALALTLLARKLAETKWDSKRRTLQNLKTLREKIETYPAGRNSDIDGVYKEYQRQILELCQQEINKKEADEEKKKELCRFAGTRGAGNLRRRSPREPHTLSGE